MLDVKIKSINRVVLEWTRKDSIKLGIMRPKRIPQEIGKPSGKVLIQGALVRSGTSNGEHDGLSHSFTDRDIFPDLMAATEQVCARVECAITLVAKVGTRPCTDDIRKDIDEAQIDDIQRGLFTEMAQARLVSTLTLNLNVKCAIVLGWRMEERT